MSRKTPLYDEHVSLKGKMVEFADYLLPIQYTSIVEEHLAVREKVGIFDVSHMGEILVEGDNAIPFLNSLISNNIEKIKSSRIKYSLFINERGNIIDDFLIYCINEKKLFLVVNAANKQKDYNWLIKNRIEGVTITDLSDFYGQIAIQGPLSKEIMLSITDRENLPLKYYSFKEKVEILNHEVLISKTGYTGEDGYEIYADSKAIKELFNKFIELGVTPCGLGARDTLRLEASMPLYGHEMSDDISPLDTNLEHFCTFDKPKYTGMDKIKDRGITRVGLINTERGIIREHMEVYANNELIGHTTSGTYLPYLKGSYAMAIINKKYSLENTIVDVKIRNRVIKAKVINLPFYKKGK
ncbi:MAG: glycine cleavage system aminomethyltransferase GcvT [Pleomorphochaeta sp.]